MSGPTVAMIGTRGVPARYGGFETAVEEVGARLAKQGFNVRVYSRDEVPAGGKYRGMEIVRLSAVRHRALETLSHTALSVGHILRHRVDAVICFNSANSLFLPILRMARIPVATHVDGLEWRRAKWSGLGRRYYRIAERLAVRWSDALIADAPGIGAYYQSEFGASTEPISYGAPQTTDPDPERISNLGLEAGCYHLVVARFEPENHVREIVKGHAASAAELPLVVVGSAPYADEYTKAVHASADDRTRFLGGVWDQDLLDALYANSYTYLHGHSVGGTNPSLLRAIGAGAATIAFNVVFNRDILGDDAWYFSDTKDVAHAIEDAETHPELTRSRSTAAAGLATRYDWDDVADQYAELCRRLVEPATRRRPRPSGRRSGAGEAVVGI